MTQSPAMLDLEDIRRITADVIAASSLPVNLQGVVNGNSDSAYTEVLIKVDGCHVEPCQLTLGVFRTTPEPDLRLEIERKLRDHLEG